MQFTYYNLRIIIWMLVILKQNGYKNESLTLLLVAYPSTLKFTGFINLVFNVDYSH